MNIRLRAAAPLIISLVMFTAGPIQASAQSIPASYSVSTFESDVVALTNTNREANGDSAVTLNATLSVAAQKKANDMLADQYFSHVSPQGVTPWHWFTQAGYTYIYAAENLAMDYYTPQAVETAWMNSPSHRANILNGKYKDIGFGIAQGTYKGKPVIFIVEFFGTEASTTSVK